MQVATMEAPPFLNVGYLCTLLTSSSDLTFRHARFGTQGETRIELCFVSSTECDENARQREEFVHHPAPPTHAFHRHTHEILTPSNSTFEFHSCSGIHLFVTLIPSDWLNCATNSQKPRS
jgi:hypothetical protein